jgi:hypothetical protein
MRSSTSFGALCAAGLVLVAPACFAQADPPSLQSAGTWALGLALQVDEESNDSKLATFNWGVTSSTWLSFAAGRSTSPADQADVTADTLVASVDQRFGRVGVAFEVEHWGDPDALESEDLRGTFYVERERFRVGFTYETRDIDVPFTLTGPLGRTISRNVGVGADGVAVDLRVSPAERWQLYFGASEHDYERDLAVLPRIDRLNLLSTSTLTLANSFVDHVRTLGVERELGRALLNLSYTRDESAIDGSRFETFDAAVLFPIAARVDLEINVGNGRSDFLGSGLDGGVLLLLYGR